MRAVERVSPREADAASTRRYFAEGSTLARVFAEAPFLPRCSTDKTASRVRPREYAISYPYMQINREGMVSWLIFDLDHSNAMIWEDKGLPAPNLIVRNRQSGSSHLFYAIPPVCTTVKARSKPIAYMQAVRDAFAARLEADMSYHGGPVAKTPGHPWWDTTELHTTVYDLGKLAEYVDLAPANPWGRAAQLDDFSHSRHCILFEHLRHYAYSIVNAERARGTFEAFTRRLEAYAHNKNSFAKLGFAQDLRQSSLRATIRSVARWTWDKYKGSGGCHRGVMGLDNSLPLSDRQRSAAARTHELRQKATESKIRAACRALQLAGQRLSQAAISKATQLTRQTVANYRAVVDEVINTPAAVRTLAPTPAPRIVKHAAHQIPAAPGKGLGARLRSVFLHDDDDPVLDPSP
jgi:hypothetical protein